MAGVRREPRHKPTQDDIDAQEMNCRARIAVRALDPQKREELAAMFAHAYDSRLHKLRRETEK